MPQIPPDENTLPVESDALFIAQRIREIDPDYCIVWRKDTQKFEVHHARSRPTYQLTLPYDTLDARAIDWVQRTRMERLQALMEEMDRHNQQIKP